VRGIVVWSSWVCTMCNPEDNFFKEAEVHLAKGPLTVIPINDRDEITIPMDIGQHDIMGG